jgi:ribulose bisphosphate carboxylase small subunit
MTDPDYCDTYWVITSSGNKVRVCLHQRFDIDHYYTSLSKLEDDNWEPIKGSSVGHGTSKDLALQRVQRLIKTYNTFG